MLPQSKTRGDKIMIEITDEYIKDGKLDKEAPARLGADVVEIEDDKITLGTIYLTSHKTIV
jgi:hypothetical protein